jgi:NADPH-dependent glutamate synthase beta subunit-like oxidoreductase
MRVGTAPEVAMRLLAEEGIPVRSMQVLKRIIGHEGCLTAVELTTMEYTEPDEAGRRTMRPVPGGEEIIEVDTVIRAIGEVYDVEYDVEELVAPLGIESMDEGFIHIDTVTRRTNHPKVWAGGDVTAGRGNHGAAYDGMWAARAIDAFLAGRLNEWRAEAAQREDIDVLVRAAEM